VNWRESLRSAVEEVLYAKGAKPPSETDRPKLSVNLDAGGREVGGAARLPSRVEPLASILKGRAIAMYCDLVKETIWLVSDDADAQRLSEPRGAVYTAAEIRELVRLTDPYTVREIHAWKRQFEGVIRSISGHARDIADE
jgi:hypothetical protein